MRTETIEFTARGRGGAAASVRVTVDPSTPDAEVATIARARLTAEHPGQGPWTLLTWTWVT